MTKEELMRGFDYDLWANTEWLPAIPRFKDPDKALEVLRHTLVAQHAWFDRIRGQSSVNVNNYEAVVADASSFARSASHWSALLAEADLDLKVEAKRPDGTTHWFSIGDIALHVINHGTYHRGHLRGLADAEDLTDFPETDWTAWMRSTGQTAQI